MKRSKLIQMGVPRGRPLDAAVEAARRGASEGLRKREIRQDIQGVISDPDAWTDHPLWGSLAAAMAEMNRPLPSYTERETPAPYGIWGRDHDHNALIQMEQAARLPIALRGALMPDAHMGYGLPIGGVLATKNAVIPWAVGMDIACRMKLSILDIPFEKLHKKQQLFSRVLEYETRFGLGASFSTPREHKVMDEDWGVGSVTRQWRDKAWRQLGTSGTGNHFVEFGALILPEPELGLEPGTYLALLSHSGSRGAGGEVARHYSRLAADMHRELPKELRRLAWFDLDSHEGREYWATMELMGRYAAANHELIHRHIIASLGAEVMAGVENHHNFAWQEQHDGHTVVVHRKGATPASEGTLGVIPGSMADPGFVVRGKGNEASLNSAAHGAGRRMSRAEAKRRYNAKYLKDLLRKRGVTLLSAGLDETPDAYKNIETVMAAQQDLVRPVARFEPRLVKMAPGNEPPED